MLGLENDALIPILRDPHHTTEEAEAVFYFPGCGSERLFSQVGLATLAMLYEIKAVIVSCGTRIDQLLQYQFEQISPGCRLLDIHEYLLEKGIALDGVGGVRYMYHDPYHTPMETYAPLEATSRLVGRPIMLSDRCCGEAGTFAIARPDIATQVRFRKKEEIKKGIKSLIGKEAVAPGQVKMLTSCPACQQGLERYTDATGVETDYVVVELASKRLGEGWQQNFIAQVKQGGIERILL